MTEAPPANANSECVGPASETAGKSSACQGCPNQGACSTGAFNTPEAKAKAQQEERQLKESLSNVSHVILVLSGKGGVGKSTIAAQLSHTLAAQGFAVGLLDVDLCGPSAPRMVLGDAYATAQVHRSGSGAWTPVYAAPNLAVMSISFLLENNNGTFISCHVICEYVISPPKIDEWSGTYSILTISNNFFFNFFSGCCVEGTP